MDMKNMKNMNKSNAFSANSLTKYINIIEQFANKKLNPQNDCLFSEN